MKKRTIGTLLGFLAMFGFGAIYYGLLTAEAGAEMAANFASCMNAEPNMPYIILANVMGAYLLVYTFDKMGVNEAKAGAYQGAMIMAIVFAMSNLFMGAQFTIWDTQGLLIEWGVGIVNGLLGGAAIGAYNSKNS